MQKSKNSCESNRKNEHSDHKLYEGKPFLPQDVSGELMHRISHSKAEEALDGLGAIRVSLMNTQ